VESSRLKSRYFWLYYLGCSQHICYLGYRCACQLATFLHLHEALLCHEGFIDQFDLSGHWYIVRDAVGPQDPDEFVAVDNQRVDASAALVQQLKQIVDEHATAGVSRLHFLDVIHDPCLPRLHADFDVQAETDRSRDRFGRAVLVLVATSFAAVPNGLSRSAVWQLLRVRWNCISCLKSHIRQMNASTRF
jgi:hypothetical protein